MAYLGVDYFGRVVVVDHNGWVAHSGACSDAELVHVGCLKGLVKLRLLASSVTDAGLTHLKGLTRLQSLDLRHTKVAEAGVRVLQEALPNLKIRR